MCSRVDFPEWLLAYFIWKETWMKKKEQEELPFVQYSQVVGNSFFSPLLMGNSARRSAVSVWRSFALSSSASSSSPSRCSCSHQTFPEKKRTKSLSPFSLSSLFFCCHWWCKAITIYSVHNPLSYFPNLCFDAIFESLADSQTGHLFAINQSPIRRTLVLFIAPKDLVLHSKRQTKQRFCCYSLLYDMVRLLLCFMCRLIKKDAKVTYSLKLVLRPRLQNMRKSIWKVIKLISHKMPHYVCV